MEQQMTLDQIRTAGFDALRERLGVAGMLRFLQQFEQGRGDYAQERHQWVDNVSDEELLARIHEIQSRPSLLPRTESPQ